MVRQKVKSIRIKPKNRKRIKRKITITRLKKDGAALNKFDFSYDEYQRFLERCPFSEEEMEIFNMRRKGYSITQIAIKLNICDRTVSKRIKSRSAVSEINPPKPPRFGCFCKSFGTANGSHRKLSASMLINTNTS